MGSSMRLQAKRRRSARPSTYPATRAWSTVVLATLVLVATVATGASLAAVGTDRAAAAVRSAGHRGWQAPPDTIVHLHGTQASGFHVEHLDGSEDYLPTRSEALAECEAYRRWRARTRCRAALRATYRALADTRRALWHAHQGS